MWKLYAAVIVVLIVGLTWGMAHVGAAEQKDLTCLKHDTATKTLAEEMDLHVTHRALTIGGKRMLEVYRSRDGSRWAMLFIAAQSPDMACFIHGLEGVGWHHVMPVPRPKPEGPIS